MPLTNFRPLEYKLSLTFFFMMSIYYRILSVHNMRETKRLRRRLHLKLFRNQKSSFMKIKKENKGRT